MRKVKAFILDCKGVEKKRFPGKGYDFYLDENNNDYTWMRVYYHSKEVGRINAGYIREVWWELNKPKGDSNGKSERNET